MDLVFVWLIFLLGGNFCVFLEMGVEICLLSYWIQVYPFLFAPGKSQA